LGCPLTLTILGPGLPIVLNPTVDTAVPITGLVAGNYVAVGQDTNGGLDAFIFVIGTVTPDLLSSIASQFDNTDCISQNGSIELDVSGGTGSYSYAWTGPNGFTEISQDIFGLEGGDYSVVVTDDGSNCTRSHGPITLANPTIAIQNISSPPAVAVCPIDDVTVSLAGSEADVIYTILVNGVASIFNTVGTGGAIDIILPSGNFNDSDILTVEGSAGVCADLLMIGTVTVTINVDSTPPTSASVSDPVYCNTNLPVGGITLSYVGGILGTGATAEWYDDAGFTSNVGSGNNLVINPAPSTSTTYFIRFEGICGNTTGQSATVTVDIAPDATITAAGPFCETDASVNLVAATAGGTWSGTGITDGVLGTFDPATATPGTHTITYTLVMGTCISIDTEDITVDSTPDATITAAGPFCQTDASVNLVAATGGGTWSGTGITNAALGTFDPATAGPGTHTITYAVTNGACMTMDNEDIVVDLAPDATITAAGPFCETDASVNLVAATGGGTWSGTGITDGVLGTFDPATATPGIHTITYTLINGACTSVDTEDITVDSTPDATITPAGPFCQTDAGVNLVAATGGGTWSGTGITNAALGIFDPATAGPGTHTITYAVTNGACMSMDTEDIMVDPIPDATIVTAGPFCETDGSINLTAATGGGTWSGTGITDAILGSFDPAIAGPGLHTITYTLTIGACNSIDTEDIVVDSTPDATITPAGPFCQTDVSINLSAVTGGGTWSGTGITNAALGTFDPATAGPGTHTITYAVTTGACMSMDNEDIVVDLAPDATITAAGPFCETDGSVNLTAATAGGTWTGTGITDGVLGSFDPALAGPGLHTISYTLTIGACTSVDTEDITVEPEPDATITAAGPFCETDASVNLAAATGGGIWSGTGITDVALGTFDPATAGIGIHTITYTITIGSCTSIDTEDIAIDATPDVTITAVGPFCETDASLNLVAATGGGTWSGMGITDGALGTFDPATAGPGLHTITYTLTIGACTSIDTEDIDVVASPSATISGPLSVCENTTETYSVPAGETSYVWTITSGDGTISSGAGTNSITVDWLLADGDLDVTVVGAAPTNCVSTSQISVVVFASLPALPAQSSDFCQNSPLPTLVATPEPGAIVTWYIGPSATGILVETGDTYTPLATELDMTTPGTTIFTYRQDIGCLISQDEDYTVNIIALPNAGTDNAISTCGSDAAIDLFTQLGGTPDTGGTWTDDDNSGALTGSIFDPMASNDGTFNFTYQVDGTGACSAESANAVVTVSVSTSVSAEIGEVVNTYPEQVIGSIETINIISNNLPVQVSLEDSGGSIIYDWLTLDPDRRGDYSYIFMQLPQNDYVVLVRDAGGCVLQLPVSISLETNVFIPNVFTPNGDGFNDSFKILNKTPNTKILISNRWGVKVFESEDYNNDWQGENLPEGVYFYSIQMNGVVYQGNVEVWKNDGPGAN
jgi:gliding motility-associated-like protein